MLGFYTKRESQSEKDAVSIIFKEKNPRTDFIYLLVPNDLFSEAGRVDFPLATHLGPLRIPATNRPDNI